MKHFLENLAARLFNRRVARRDRTRVARGLYLGARFVDGTSSQGGVYIEQSRRAEHLAVLGKTGVGKSFLLRSLARQDIQSNRGFVFFDLHGDSTPFLLGTIADQEKVLRINLDDRVVVVEPADPDRSVGINPVESRNRNNRFIQIAEFTNVLRQRWHLESFGARTDELLRNSLFALAENGLTLLELGLFLSHAGFRARCIGKITNAEIRQYFEHRYESVSDAMQAVMREPILNKISAFTADPHFRHIVGQQHSTFSLIDAIDRGYWIILNLHKGELGDQSATLGSLFLTMIKNTLFARNSRNLFTLYCDEIQNLVAYGSGLETMLSEARKFAISIVSANQFLDQYPPEMRAAILAVGTHAYFQPSSSDAQQIATALDGGKTLAETLKNLPRRHFVVRIGAERWQQAVVPTLAEPKTDPANLYSRCRARWARTRNDIEAEIRQRQAIANRTTNEVLHGWE